MRAVALLVAAWAAAALLAPVERATPLRTGQEATRYFDLATRARPALLGFDALAADMVWLEAIQHVADRVRARQDLAGLYPLLDAATEFDRRYLDVYWLGGTALVTLDRRPDEAVALLEKGRAALPRSWELAYLLGYTHLFYYQDYARAADYIEEAARKVGRPTFYPALAARLRAQAGDPEAALAFLEDMRRTASDPALRQAIETRIAEVIVDRDLRVIDAATVRYRETRRRAPETVVQLVRAGLLERLPVEPFGGRYAIDPMSGRAASSSGHGRLAVHRQNWQGGAP